jgi:hypothetical protein
MRCIPTFTRTQAGVKPKGPGYRSAVDDLLEVDLPADTPSLRVARLVLWEAATRAGLDCDTADDLCLALDEVCFAVFARVPSADRLSLRIQATDGVSVEGHVRGDASDRSIELGNLAQTLLAVTVDEFELHERRDGVHFTMTKHAPVMELR